MEHRKRGEREIAENIWRELALGGGVGERENIRVLL
jgi:hypothetical protein